MVYLLPTIIIVKSSQEINLPLLPFSTDSPKVKVGGVRVEEFLDLSLEEVDQLREVGYKSQPLRDGSQSTK